MHCLTPGRADVSDRPFYVSTSGGAYYSGLCRSNSTEPTGLSKQRANQGVELHGIIVHGPNGTVYDLSSAFNPDVDEYGTSVPPSFVNGSLCILPGNGEAQTKDPPSISVKFYTLAT